VTLGWFFYGHLSICRAAVLAQRVPDSKLALAVVKLCIPPEMRVFKLHVVVKFHRCMVSLAVAKECRRCLRFR
jgi:hypothetical protein